MRKPIKFFSIFITIQFFLMPIISKPANALESLQTEMISIDNYILLANQEVEFNGLISSSGFIGSGLEGFNINRKALLTATPNDIVSPTQAQSALKNVIEDYDELFREECLEETVFDKPIGLISGINCLSGESIDADELSFISNEQPASGAKYVVVVPNDFIFKGNFQKTFDENGIALNEVVWLVNGNVQFENGIQFVGMLLSSGNINIGDDFIIDGLLVSFHESIIINGSGIIRPLELPANEEGAGNEQVFPIYKNVDEPPRESTLTPEIGEPSDPHPLLINNGGEAIPSEFIVVLKESFSTNEIVEEYRNSINSSSVEITDTFPTSLNGFAAKLDENGLQTILQDFRVEFVEPNYVFHNSQEEIETESAIESSIEETQRWPTWGLDRIDQRNLGLSQSYTYDNEGQGVHVYVVDSGINYEHEEFNDLTFGDAYDAVKDGYGTWDCSGHGTHVSGTIAGNLYGVAKSVILHSIRVFGCSDTTPTDLILNGIEWIITNRKLPAVANMSLGGSASKAMDTAVQRLINRGVTVVVSAGNEGEDACTVSPARLPAAITVAASNDVDRKPEWSNYGSCVDIFAPGEYITSASYYYNDGTETMSGTSMAAPHVTGSIALILKVYPQGTPDAVTKYLLSNATIGKIPNPMGSPNRLLYSRLPIPTPLQPWTASGDIQPWYKWTRVSNASKYQIQVFNGSQLVYSKTFAAEACPGGVCAKQFYNVLPYGVYNWRVRAYVGGNWMLFSPGMSFTVSRFIPRGLKPMGTVYTQQPKFRWSKVSTATSYILQIVQNGTAIHTKTISPNYCGNTECAITFRDILSPGNYRFRVKAYARGMWNPYGTYTNFTVALPIPKLIAPSGEITVRSPQYIWTHIPGATVYQLQVMKDNKQVYLKVFDATANICTGSTCKIQFYNVLTPGKYSWRVKALYKGVWHPYPQAMWFTVK